MPMLKGVSTKNPNLVTLVQSAANIVLHESYLRAPIMAEMNAVNILHAVYVKIEQCITPP